MYIFVWKGNQPHRALGCLQVRLRILGAVVQVDDARAFAVVAHPAHGLVVVDSDAGHGVKLMLRKYLVYAAESHRAGVAVGLFAVLLCDQDRGLLLHIVQGPDGNQRVSVLGTLHNVST